ncbi:hypothetical protein WR25_19617 [Diploscapter pachys]|uniref:Major sperm protein n=1 Tax=Diploscapter pachys TaxID=2018661 RepID=A0A2A2JTA8_9BILA|nr:hypothetical protein WR25_19617 [Diploscapter pachys]
MTDGSYGGLLKMFIGMFYTLCAALLVFNCASKKKKESNALIKKEVPSSEVDGGAKPPGASTMSKQNQVKEPEKKQAVDTDDKKAEDGKKEAKEDNKKENTKETQPSKDGTGEISKECKGDKKEVSQTTKKEIAPGISLKPAMLHFNVKEDGQEVLTLSNETGKVLLLKLKITDNELYSVNPIYSALSNKESKDIAINRKQGSPKLDKVEICTLEVDKKPTEDRIADIFKEKRDKVTTNSIPIEAC